MSKTSRESIRIEYGNDAISSLDVVIQKEEDSDSNNNNNESIHCIQEEIDSEANIFVRSLLILALIIIIN